MVHRKIQLIISGLPLISPHVGQGVYTVRLINALARRGDINFAVIARPDLEVPQGLPTDKFIFLPKARTPKHHLLAQILWAERLLRFMAREFPNAVFHSPGPISGTVRLKRAIVTLHDCIYRRFPRYTGRFFVRKLFLRSTERFAARSSMVLTDSEFSKKELVAQAGIPAERIDVLYPWISSEYFKPISNADINRTKRKFNLPDRFWLYIGGYDYRKNIEFLLRAYAEASRKSRLPTLVLAGDIPPLTRATCNVYGTLKDFELRDSQVLLPGRIANTDLPVVYRAASLFIFPSLMEGFGLPPAEAMAVGTPVLVSNKASLPEVVPTVCCLFDPRQQDSLTTKLIAAAANERQFTAVLRDQFTEAYAVKRYLDFVNNIAGGNHVSS